MTKKHSNFIVNSLSPSGKTTRTICNFELFVEKNKISNIYYYSYNAKIPLGKMRSIINAVIRSKKDFYIALGWSIGTTGYLIKYKKPTKRKVVAKMKIKPAKKKASPKKVAAKKKTTTTIRKRAPKKRAVAKRKATSRR